MPHTKHSRADAMCDAYNLRMRSMRTQMDGPRTFKQTLGEEAKRKMMIKCLAAVSLIILLVIPAQASPEYLCLTANGNEMAPTICNGDSITVQLGINASLINPESRANPGSGDIIVYAAIVAGYEGAMWTYGRVISKYFKDGHWCFKTKLDSRSKTDPWEVLDYEIFGIVVDVVPNGNTQDKG